MESEKFNNLLADTMENAIQIIAETTPNPFAMKFVLNRPVKSMGKAGFSKDDTAVHVPLAEMLLSIPSVSQVHFFQNCITVTQDGSETWDVLEDMVERFIMENIELHDPNFLDSLAYYREGLTPELREIEEILDFTIRPALQADGGDVEVVEFDKEHKILTIAYEGACGSCPSSTMGTLDAIRSVLQDEFDPNLEIALA